MVAWSRCNVCWCLLCKLENFFFYAFPPFSLIGKCLEKIQANKAEGILVVPCWTYQSWYPKLLRLLVAPPLMITHRETLLILPGCQKLYPFRNKLNLLACHLCRDSLQSWRQSSQKQYDTHIRKWLLFCTKRQADPICLTISMAVDFLTTLYDEGLSYSSINSAWCALSAILESPAPSSLLLQNLGYQPGTPVHWLHG